MSVERQQGSDYQRTFDFEGPDESLRPDQNGEDGIQPVRYEERQSLTALTPARALTASLMEEVTNLENLNRAYRRVLSNQGAPGVDGMTVQDLKPWVTGHKAAFLACLLDGTYQPQPVRGVQIPKPGGGVRQLGIPTVVDRLVQQAILQVLERLLDPTFSASSFGFRAGRGAHQALAQTRGPHSQAPRPHAVDAVSYRRPPATPLHPHKTRPPTHHSADDEPTAPATSAP